MTSAPKIVPPTTTARPYAAHNATDRFARRAPGPHDVQIQILFCSVCHSDLHAVRNKWNPTYLPSTRWSPDTKSSATSPRSAMPSPNLKKAISPP